jgi:hypothetical protein
MMGVTVGTRSIHGMIRLSVARLRPQCVLPSLKRPPALYGACRNAHAGAVDCESKVESTSLLRIVQNKVSEFSNLRSEVSYDQHVNPDLRSCIYLSCLEIILRKMILHVLSG